MTTARAILKAKIDQTQEQIWEAEEHLYLLSGSFYEVGETAKEKRSLRGRIGQLRNKLDKLKRELGQLDQMRLPFDLD